MEVFSDMHIRNIQNTLTGTFRSDISYVLRRLIPRRRILSSLPEPTSVCIDLVIHVPYKSIPPQIYNSHFFRRVFPWNCLPSSFFIWISIFNKAYQVWLPGLRIRKPHHLSFPFPSKLQIDECQEEIGCMNTGTDTVTIIVRPVVVCIGYITGIAVKYPF